MTTYYYSIDIEIDNYVGDSGGTNINGIAKRTVGIVETIKGTKGKEIIRDNFTEEYFNANNEQLASKAITDYNQTHKNKISRIIGIRRTPIIE